MLFQSLPNDPSVHIFSSDKFDIHRKYFRYFPTVGRFHSYTTAEQQKRFAVFGKMEATEDVCYVVTLNLS